VELVNSVDGNCGIDCSTTSGIKLDITNLGGSVTDGFVEAKSIHRKSVFPSSKNHNEYCFGLPVHSAQTDTVNIDIRQDNQALSFPNNTGADKIVVEIAYRNPAKLNYKEELGSIPGNSNFSGRLKLGLDLRGP
jgi:hypothetical protein